MSSGPCFYYLLVLSMLYIWFCSSIGSSESIEVCTFVLLEQVGVNHAVGLEQKQILDFEKFWMLSSGISEKCFSILPTD